MASALEHQPRFESLVVVDKIARSLLDAGRVSGGTAQLSSPSSRRSRGGIPTVPTPLMLGQLTKDQRLWLSPTRLHASILRFPSLGNLQKMTLSRFFLSPFTPQTFGWCFGGPLPRLQVLRLDPPVSCPQTLVHFIASFPNLRETLIYAPIWTRETGKGSRLFSEHLPHTPRLRGALYLNGLAPDSGRFFSYLVTQMPNYEKVSLGRSIFGNGRPLQSFISSIGTSLKALHMFLFEGRELSLSTKYHKALTLR